MRYLILVPLIIIMRYLNLFFLSSCVWTMNKDGTLAKKDAKGKGKVDDVWYGRTVIKSCARLDYATAQNIIDRKVATGEKYCDEAFWPKSR